MRLMPLSPQANKGKIQELQALRGEFGTKLSEQDATLKSEREKMEKIKVNLKGSEARCAGLEERLKSLDEEVQKAGQPGNQILVSGYTNTTPQVSSQLEQKDQEKQVAQNELDDLLMVFADLEEKLSKYKVSYLFRTTPSMDFVCLG